MSSLFYKLKEGRIGTTGRILRVQCEDGSIKEFPEPEEIHTYAAWKSLGFQVKRGEHAIAKFTIWKYAQSRRENDEDDSQQTGRMFMKLSHFFSPEQVEKAGA